MALKISKHILLIVIVAIAFAYRFALMTMNGFPPGADIGLHESVIKSITTSTNKLFLELLSHGQRPLIDKSRLPYFCSIHNYNDRITRLSSSSFGSHAFFHTYSCMRFLDYKTNLG